MGFVVISLQLAIIFIFIIVSILIISRLWSNLRTFFHGNYTFFEIIFTLVYFIEQIAFTLLSYFYESYSKLLIGLFALIVLTTVSLEKIMMNSRQAKISLLKDKYLTRSQELISENEKIISAYDELKLAYEEVTKYTKSLEEFIENT